MMMIMNIITTLLPFFNLKWHIGMKSINNTIYEVL